ncbi:MAG: hypothetical protein C0483_01035 [Pirellula sp.]|nr:hypothetical protein [Pirellula sp.]
MSLSLDEIAGFALEDILRLPNVGPKKIGNLAMILTRTIAEPCTTVTEVAREAVEAARPLWSMASSVASPLPAVSRVSEVYAQVDELLWEHWCFRIRRWGLAEETLGHCVARLRDLPRSLWFVPVHNFLYLSYDELLRIRGFGVKRVAVIVELFRSLDAVISAQENALAESAGIAHSMKATPVVAPPFIATVDAAVEDVVVGRYAWCTSWFANTVVRGLWQQLQIDGDETTRALVAERLGWHPGALASHTQLRVQGLSRAHRFGILFNVSTMVQARWPRGESLLNRLLQQLTYRNQVGIPAGDDFVALAIGLFFPALKDSLAEWRRRSNDGLRQEGLPLTNRLTGFSFATPVSTGN